MKQRVSRCVWVAAILCAMMVPRLGAQGISADPSITPLPAASLRAMAPADLWQALNAAEYWAVPREIPAGYYSSIVTTNAVSLRQSLNTIIGGHRAFAYTHSSRPGNASHEVDVWDIVLLADAHPERPDRVLDLYWNNTFDQQLAGTASNPRYDREHSWPKSLGFPDQDRANVAYSDCHHLFAAYQSYNASRSNKPYGEAAPDATDRRPTAENVGRGGALMDEPDSSNYSFRDHWQVWRGRRGDVARAMFYMDLRYEGSINEPDLVLTDDLTQITQRNVWRSGGQAFMGMLQVLIKWHHEDPVDDLERRRNAVVFLFQGNRNPFVDHPEWVGPLFAGQAIGPVPVEEPPATATAAGMHVWINEIHYDNDGADQGEFVEVCGRAGTDLSGWTLVAYNGTGGRKYMTIALSGLITDQLSGFGTLAVGVTGLQNGPADGLALVDGAGRVVELISYEGRFTAADGPASGLVASDIRVEQAPSTPIDRSLQRRGQGAGGPDFQWHGPHAASRGRINDGQSFR